MTPIKPPKPAPERPRSTHVLCRVHLPSDDDSLLAWQVRRAIESSAADAMAIRLDAHTAPWRVEIVGTDFDDDVVALAIVDEAGFDDACQEVSRRLADRPGRRVLAVTQGLTAAQLSALQAAGVADFVRAPVAADELLARVLHLCPAAMAIPAATTVTSATAPVARAPALRGLLGSSPAFMALLDRLPQVARFDVGALLLGETGTGKEALAQAIHYLSPRAKGPWVAVNCAAIPLELLEAELFGHVKGAYTHASETRHGLIHEAQGGTLLLDEIDSLPYGAQAKLLRFLQDKQYRPVGANAPVTADVRIIAASNRELDALVAQGGFRQDLLFRLNVLQLRLPPLRERLDDLPLLAQHFLDGAARTFNQPTRRFAPGALQRLQTHAWPGNVRELKNVIERAVLMSGAECLGASDIDLAAAPEHHDGDAEGEDSFCAAKARVIASFERGYISQLLSACGGNVSQAARAAKKNRRAFFELMRKHQIKPDGFREAA
jgi:two-component system, NtrC family, response regulator GlrR